MTLRALCFWLGGTLPLLSAEPVIRSFEAPYPAVGDIERLSPKLDQLLAPGVKMEKLAEGFNWSEGPVWLRNDGYLLFSDVPENKVYRWRPDAGIDVFLTPSGFTGEGYDGTEPGSNGLTLDAAGRLVLAQHGDRQVARLNSDGRTFTPLASRWDGRRFNSPNDLCFDRAGNLYFTDPPYGLARSATREIDFHGVYRARPDGTVELLVRDLERPNGIALSPDERTLYVANSHGPRPIIMAYQLGDDGRVVGERLVFDTQPLMRQGRRGVPDGLKVDRQGHLWATGAGGVLILTPSGEHLGTLLTGRLTANCAFGGPDGSVLYMTADDVLCRVQTKVQGASFDPGAAVAE